ncbi:AfsR/SARP family transcriptional regulator [Aquipuribacter sp. SD81]|uniref:AfsR/SARP family transcriptional regulator n=1 Tax=Aquipuribacter sp. SD81 TaxID=3127703 RepID=UPI00301AC8D8
MLRLLGEVVLDGTGPVPGRARRVLLATLALARPAPVSVDGLVDAVWGGDPPAHPVAALHNQVSRLRSSLPTGIAVTATPEGYRLDAVDDLVDAARLEGALARAAALPPGHRLPVVDEALALWRGEPYACLDDPVAAGERERLSRVRAALADVRAEDLVSGGRVLEAVVELEGRLPGDPLRERTVELLMRAYVAAGRRADALAAYRDLHARSVDELGLDPSPALRALHAAVVDDTVEVPRPAGTVRPGREAAAEPPVREPVSQHVRTPVPPPMPPPVPHRPVVRLVGRDGDAALASRLLAGHRSVTLVGPGGVGKTRLAEHVAAAVPDRVVTVAELATAEDPADVDGLVASSLRAAPTAGRTARDRVLATLRHGRHLLLLDNCEHVAAAAADLVDAVLAGTPDVTVLATGREPLDVDGERVVRLDPLPPEEAVRLFADRAASLGLPLPSDERTRERVARVCRAVDGLPLGVELAAARLQAMTLEELVERVDDLLGLLVGGRRSTAARHRSLRGLVEWSVRDLPPVLHRTFVRFAVFAGPVDAATAAGVCGGDATEVRDRLAGLARRSLLVQVREPGRPLRYRCLQTVRAYAQDLLEAGGEAGNARDAHARLVVAAAEAAASLDGSATEPLPALAEVRAAHRHLLAVGDGHEALRLAAALHHPALFRMQAEVYGWVAETAARFGDLDDQHTERVVAAAATGAWQTGDLERARLHAAHAERVAARSSWPDAGGSAAEARADVLLFDGDLDGAAGAWEESVVRSRAGGRDARLLTRLADRAMVAGYLDRLDVVESCLAEARALLPAHESWFTAWVDYAEGEALAGHDPTRALDALDRALAAARRTGADFTTGVAGLTWVGLRVRAGDAVAAGPVLRDLLLRWRRAAAWVQQWITLRTAVELLERLGEHVAAARVLGAVEASGTVGVTGPDAERLHLLGLRLAAALPDAAAHRDAGADLDRDAVVDLVLSRLPAGSDSTATAP